MIITMRFYTDPMIDEFEETFTEVIDTRIGGARRAAAYPGIAARLCGNRGPAGKHVDVCLWEETPDCRRSIDSAIQALKSLADKHGCGLITFAPKKAEHEWFQAAGFVPSAESHPGDMGYLEWSARADS